MSSNEYKEEEWERKLLDSFKDLKPDMVRGQTPEDIEQRCFELCRTYMVDHPRWKEYCKTVKDLTVKRITGGFTNQLYKVALKHVNDSCQNDTITVKFYQSKFLKLDNENQDPTAERLNDIIISIIVSERKIGPKVFGITQYGLIQSYHEHEQFRPKQQQNKKLVQKLAHILAEVNSLDVPIPKNRFSLLDILMNFIHSGYKRIDLKTRMVEMNLKYLMENDFINEIQWFDSFIRGFNECPMVFCHNDFRGSNMMVVNDSDIILCDFEYSSYGLRGFDIATFLQEWGRELFDFNEFNMPSDDVMEQFIKFYLEGCDRLKPGYSEKSENSLKQIMNETKIGYLFLHVYFIGVIINQREGFFDEFPYDIKQQCESIHLMFKRYLEVKKNLIKENIIQI